MNAADAHWRRVNELFHAAIAVPAAGRDVTGFIASGGMGDVYRARDTRLGRDAALKVLPSPVVSDPDRRARFEREARTLASLTHPHIATIYGVEETNFLF